MTGRAVAESAVGILLGLLLSLIGLGLIQLSDGTDAATAFLDEAPRLLLGILWPAIIVWVVLVIIGNVRNRRRGSVLRMITNLVSTFVAALLAVIGWFILAAVQGDWAWFVFAIALVAALVFFVATSIGFVLTHLVFFRSRSQAG